MAFPTSEYPPEVLETIEKALTLADYYLEYFNFRRGDKQTTTLEFPFLMPALMGSGIAVPLTREAHGNTERLGIERLCKCGWGYSLWTNRRVVSASKDRVVLDIEFSRNTPGDEQFSLARTLYYVVRRKEPLPLSSLNILLQEHRQLVSEWGVQVRGTTPGSLVSGVLVPDPNSELATKVNNIYRSNIIAPPVAVFPPGPTDKNPAELYHEYPLVTDQGVLACISGFLHFAAGKPGSNASNSLAFPNWLIPTDDTAKSFDSPSDLGSPSPVSDAIYKLSVRVSHPGDDTMFVDAVVEHACGRRLLGYDPAKVENKSGVQKERAALVLGKVEGQWKIRARLMVD